MMEMTPEQQDLLMVKCTKQYFKDADLTAAAVGAVVSGLFGKGGKMPTDLLDERLGYEVDLPTNDDPNADLKELTPTIRRQLQFKRWNWGDQEVIAWLNERSMKYGAGYELWNYFTQDELDKYQVCLLKKPEQGDTHGTGSGNDSRREYF